MPVVPSKYLTRVAGAQVLVSTVSSGGTVAEEGAIVSLGANGLLNPNMIPVNALSTTNIVVEAAEALDAHSYINLFDDAGINKVRKADASQERPAHGYVELGVAAGSNATVQLTGMNKSIGLIIGTRYFLSSTTPGAVTAIPTEDVGHIIQFLGVAVPMNATDMGIQFEYDDYISC